MACHVCLGASLQCSFGAAPSSLVVLPKNRFNTSKVPGANIADNVPFTNVLPFGVCSSLANPAVASATAAALGVLTPMPCTPVIPAPWMVGAPTVLLAGLPALNDSSTLACAYGGVIQIISAGQVTETVP